MQQHRSVQPDWCLALPIQQQSVLLLASRGPDGVAKMHPCNVIQRALRGTVLVAARYGRLLRMGEKADTFMSLEVLGDPLKWNDAVHEFFQHHDSLPHHYLMHLIHAAEICGYKHPDETFRTRWRMFYLQAVLDLHLMPESEDMMDERLGDWKRVEWEQGRSLPVEGVVQRVLAQHASRCLDDDDDRAVVAYALVRALCVGR